VHDTSTPLLAQIMSALRNRYASLNRHYEAAWNDSWHFRRCFHIHHSLIEAAKCAMPSGAGWYLVRVEFDQPRELTEEENQVVNEFRFNCSPPTEKNPFTLAPEA
jgi:hypothetical protein